MTSTQALNVLGDSLQCCCNNPMTGFYRDGYCHTGPDDQGVHTVCAKLTTEFLAFSKAQGNDLSTPRPEYQFPGLKDGDKWCLCVSRWKEALDAGSAPAIFLESTHQSAVNVVSLDQLLIHAA